uniref:Uncharacterized protein n=1 Tax=Parascaris equorum TaxID=6256 RepID=A0A914S8M0_PAREQ
MQVINSHGDIIFQDQYREEEIEEFRELQRELEQNAKNCRILQFKLRKSERVRDQLETEKQHLEAKVRVHVILWAIMMIRNTMRLISSTRYGYTYVFCNCKHALRVGASSHKLV